MATPKKTKADTTATRSVAPKPLAIATRVKPVRVIPTGPAPNSKTLANGQPRPKSRRGR